MTTQSSVFDRTCEELERATSFDSLSARGTIRLALKSAGLDARTVSSEQMTVVLKRVLPSELGARGVADPDKVCATVASRISGLAPSPAASGSSVEEIFRRLGGT